MTELEGHWVEDMDVDSTIQRAYDGNQPLLAQYLSDRYGRPEHHYEDSSTHLFPHEIDEYVPPPQYGPETFKQFMSKKRKRVPTSIENLYGGAIHPTANLNAWLSSNVRAEIDPQKAATIDKVS